ncbi:MAG: hypothetical protein RLZ35_597 [Pseudomonadota bacterium]|jgi:TatD DNase family protein
MKFVDSHCHLHLINYEALNSDMPSVVAVAKEKQVAHMLCVATDFSEHTQLCQIAEQFDNVSISVGLHPNESMTMSPNQEMLLALATHEKVVAIGETGLDYYREASQQYQSVQKEWFVAHIDVAKQLKKPLIIHTRMAKKDTIDLLKAQKVSDAGAVLHCFTEDWEMAKQALDLGLYISFSGIITFKNAEDLRTVVKKIPIDQLLIETDAPFLAPVPFRGKVNQPAYVYHVAETIASLKNLSLEFVAEQTTHNFEQLFRLQI